MSLADVAAALPWPVFACGDDKRPVVETGFKAATRDAANIRAQFSRPAATLIGVPTGLASGLVVIDVDIKEGKDGRRWLNVNASDLPPTRTHKTRSGGLHLLFRSPANVEIRNSASKLAPGVDVRGEGGYIIVPPSTGYTVADDTQPAEMPEWLVNACMRQQTPQELAPRPQERLEKYTQAAIDGEVLAVMRAAEGTRNDTLNKAAVKLGTLVAAGQCSRGVVEAELQRAAQLAGLDARETAATIKSGLDFGTTRPREMPEARAEVPRKSAEVSSGAPQEVPQDDFGLIDPRQWTAPAKAREWIVPEWIPRGVVTALYGDGGMGKSLLSQQLMSCVALGRPWLGLDVFHGRALGVMCEDDPDELHRRQESINASMKCGPEVWANLRYASRVGFDNVLMAFDGKDVGELTRVFHDLDAACEAFKPDLLVCDTIADFFAGNENNRAQVRQFVQNSFGRLARKHHCGLLICGHPSVAGISSGSGTGGSTAWNNTVRSRMYLTKPEGENTHPDARLLSRKKANYAARDAEVNLIWRNGAFEPQSAEEAEASALPEWEIVSGLLDMIQNAWKAGTPFSIAVQTRAQGRYLPSIAAKRLPLTETAAKRLVVAWIEAGHVETAEVDSHSKKSGLRVVRRFDYER